MELPTGVGDGEAQQKFISRFKPFLLEYPNVSALLKRVFLRSVQSPSPEELKPLEGLLDTDPVVIAFNDRWWANQMVFFLGRIAADDFGEVLVLAGNARGVGAYKVLRGMYERLVTASYIAKNPAEVQPFMDDLIVKNWKLWKRSCEAIPDLVDNVSKEEIAFLEKAYQEVKDMKPRPDLANMAKKSDTALANLYAPCYLEPTFHSHATMFGVQRRLRREQGKTSFRESTEKEARIAVELGHQLVLRVILLQNNVFSLGLDDELKARADAFLAAWKEIPPG